MQRARQLRQLWRAARSNPEIGGIVCQGRCAELVLAGLCDPGTAFLDIGAHIGSVTASVRHHHPCMRIIAVEAVPEKAAALAARFPEVEVHNCALGEDEHDVTFFIDTKRSGYSSLTQGRRSERDVREVSVQMRRLDEIIDASIQVDVIKIDVEGAELGVFRGSPELVQRCRPAVLFESSLTGAETMGFTAGRLFDWFDEREYEVLVPNRVAHDAPSLSREGFLEAHHYPCRTLDYFAIPRDRRTDFRDRARRALGVVPAT